MPKVTPVDLSLFADQRHQAKVGLGCGTWPVMRNEVAKVIGAATVTTLPGHAVQTTGAQRREFLQGFMNERQVGVDAGGAHGPDARQTGLAQEALDDAVVYLQLAGDGADAPTLNMVVTHDLGVQFRGHGHGAVPCGQVKQRLDVCDSAEIQYAQTHRSCPGRNGTARMAATAVMC